MEVVCKILDLFRYFWFISVPSTESHSTFTHAHTDPHRHTLPYEFFGLSLNLSGRNKQHSHYTNGDCQINWELGLCLFHFGKAFVVLCLEGRGHLLLATRREMQIFGLNWIWLGVRRDNGKERFYWIDDRPLRSSLSSREPQPKLSSSIQVSSNDRVSASIS